MYLNLKEIIGNEILSTHNNISNRFSIFHHYRWLSKQKIRRDEYFFWIFYADYFVMELDENYKWALIGSKSDKYLWILSRTPKLEESVKKLILEKAQNRGYDTSKLIWVEQKGN